MCAIDPSTHLFSYMSPLDSSCFPDSPPSSIPIKVLFCHHHSDLTVALIWQAPSKLPLLTTRISPTLQLAPDRPPAFFPSRSNLPFSDDLKLPYQTFCATCSPALTSPPFYQLLHSHDQPPALALGVLFSGLTFTKTFHSVCERPLLAVS